MSPDVLAVLGAVSTAGATAIDHYKENKENEIHVGTNTRHVSHFLDKKSKK